ncbi:hypothetical protein CDAR_304341 [Caerostris darwini]|uniref:C2H2-type domain-containing protein n=1 Tax=Caerostris darwini TaxID=1538125 RepID=A0AAV4P0Z5_9ARAC|nr:hypothetical protein CDAR_304341 [Caerostris darwini]
MWPLLITRKISYLGQVVSHFKRKIQNLSMHKRNSNAIVKGKLLFNEIQEVISTTNKESPLQEFKCPYCPFTAQFNSLLKRHILIHTGEKPFSCSMLIEWSTLRFKR